MKYLKLIEWISTDGARRKYRLVEHVSGAWKQFGYQIDLPPNKLEGWYSDTRNNERCWERVMEAWLEEGRGQRLYPPTWEGLYKLLRDVQKAGVNIPALKEAVDRAVDRPVLPGVLIVQLSCSLLIIMHDSLLDCSP